MIKRLQSNQNTINQFQNNPQRILLSSDCVYFLEDKLSRSAKQTSWLTVRWTGVFFLAMHILCRHPDEIRLSGSINSEYRRALLFATLQRVSNACLQISWQLGLELERGNLFVFFTSYSHVIHFKERKGLNQHIYTWVRFTSLTPAFLNVLRSSRVTLQDCCLKWKMGWKLSSHCCKYQRSIENGLRKRR